MAFPSLGAIVAKELGKRDVVLPNFITIGRGSQEALTAGFLGPDQQPLTVDDPIRGLDFIEPAGEPKKSARKSSCCTASMRHSMPATRAQPAKRIASRSPARCG